MVFPPFGVGEEEEKFPKVCDKCRVIMWWVSIKIKSGSQVQSDIIFYKIIPTCTPVKYKEHKGCTNTKYLHVQS